MVRPIFYLLIFIGMSSNLVAQQLHAEKKVSVDSTSFKVGFRQKSHALTNKKSTPENTASIPVTNPQSAANTTTANTGKDAAKVSEIMKLDYHNMQPDVQSKINSNKLLGKNLLDGVVKVFTVEMNACATDAEHKTTLLFLKSKKGFIGSQFISTGLVKIIVDPTFDSPELKDALKSKDIRFNFLNRSYALKN